MVHDGLEQLALTAWGSAAREDRIALGTSPGLALIWLYILGLVFELAAVCVLRHLFVRAHFLLKTAAAAATVRIQTFLLDVAAAAFRLRRADVALIEACGPKIGSMRGGEQDEDAHEDKQEGFGVAEEQRHGEMDHCGIWKGGATTLFDLAWKEVGLGERGEWEVEEGPHYIPLSTR
ncbi:hypothetical protein FA10DRAFT_293609, partial [Acaromyces ingoldii]